MSSIPKSEILRTVYWRSEILRVMYWLRGEGLGDLVDVPLIQRFLDVSARDCEAHLDGLGADGYVVRDGTWYSLSARGLTEGEAEFATAFADLARPSSGPCSDECWCQMSSAEEEACGAQRVLPRNGGVPTKGGPSTR